MPRRPPAPCVHSLLTRATPKVCFAAVWILAVGLAAQISNPAADTVERLIDAGKLEEAGTLLRRQVIASGENARALFLEAMILHRQERYAESNLKLKQSLERDRKQPDALKLAGLNLVALGESKAARPFFEEAVELAPDDAVAHYYLGMAAIKDLAYEFAATEFHEAIRLEPGYVDAYCSLGVALEQKEEYEPAMRAYRKAMEVRDRLGGRTERPELNLGRLLVWLNRHEEGLPLLEKAHEMAPASGEVLFSLGEAYERLGRDADALRAFEKAAAIRPSDKQTHHYLLRLYRRAGRRAEAERELAIVRELTERERREAVRENAGRP